MSEAFRVMSGPADLDEAATKAVTLKAPSLDSRHLALANRLSVRRRPITVRLGSNDVLSLSPAGLATIEPEPGMADRLMIGLRIDGRSATLRLSAGLFERILERIDPALLVADLHDEMLPLLLEASLAEALSAAEAAYGGRIELLTIERGRAVERSGLDLLFDIAINGDAAGKASLRLDDVDAERLADALVARPKMQRRFGNLKAELSFRGGVMWLDLGELRSLKVGDILLPDDDPARDEDIALTLGETWLLNATFKDAGLTLTKPFRRATTKDRDLWMMADSKSIEDDDEPLTDPFEEGREPAEIGNLKSKPRPDAVVEPGPKTEPSDERQADDATFDEVPIKLVFELGRQEISLGRLQELGPGHVFQLDRPIGEAVEVFAGGRRVGQGEIVQIDQQVGVRMTRLFGHG